jgi:glycosyltransferase involved in cell wall biosynthesis/ribosomal protein S18 acetylase RimI-like enzyme
MKVVHLTTVDLSLRYLLLPQLTEASRWGEVIGVSAPGPHVAELEERGIRHVPLPGSTRGFAPLSDLRAAAGLWRILRQERPDVLHTHNPKPGIYGRIVGRLAGVPVVVNTVHGLYAAPDDRLTQRLPVYLLEALASRFSDVELVQNPEDLHLMRRLRIAPPRKLVLLGNGVDLERFNPENAARHREETRRELGVAPNEILVGMVGRLVAEKGYPELFRAARRLGPGYRVVVVGPDDPEKPDSLDREVISDARAAGVVFLGMRTDVERLYGAFDVFVLPSHREGFPRAAMEAAASGLPVVATDIRGCRQVVEPGVTGLLVPVGDPGALAEAITRLGDDPDLRASMGQAAAAKARAEFDERQVVAKVVDTYRRVLADKGLGWMMSRPGRAEIRPGRRGDARTVAELHRRGIETGFLSSLGVRFLQRLYRFMLTDPSCRVLVAADADDQIVGFIAGTADTAGLYRRFLEGGGVTAGLAAAPRMLRPSVTRRLWETLRYGTDRADGPELLAMAVAPGWRGQGLGKSLVDALKDWARQEGLDRMRVVVGADNRPAIALYRQAGFGRPKPMSVHSGERSLELTWRP